MNSRERIQTTLSHREPDLIPYDFAGFQQLLNERPVRNLTIKHLTKCYSIKLHLLLELTIHSHENKSFINCLYNIFKFAAK